MSNGKFVRFKDIKGEEIVVNKSIINKISPNVIDFVKPTTETYRVSLDKDIYIIDKETYDTLAVDLCQNNDDLTEAVNKNAISLRNIYDILRARLH